MTFSESDDPVGKILAGNHKAVVFHIRTLAIERKGSKTFIIHYSCDEICSNL